MTMYSRINIIYCICVLLPGLGRGQNGNNNLLTMDVTPGDRIGIGRRFTITCEVDTERSNDVEWYRRVGDIRLRIGYNNAKDPILVELRRYSFTRGNSGRFTSYSLIVNDAKYEDTAIYECQISGSNNVVEKVGIAVCDDTEADSCKCMTLIPSESVHQRCYEPDGMKHLNEENNRIIIGLGVILAIVIIYGVIMTLLVGRDCIQQKGREQMAKLRASQEEAQRRRSAMDPTEITRLPLDHNDSGSNLETTLPENGLSGTPQKPGPIVRGAAPYTGAEAVPRPKQRGRQAERKEAQHQQPSANQHAASPASRSGGVANTAYLDDGPSANPIGQADIGYAPHPDTRSPPPPGASNPYGIGSMPEGGGARQKQQTGYKMPVPKGASSHPPQPMHAAPPAPSRGTSSQQAAAMAPPRYNDLPPTKAPYSADRGAPMQKFDVQDRGAYTDVEKRRQGAPVNGAQYTKPKHLDFESGEGRRYGQGGAYVENSDSVV